MDFRQANGTPTLLIFDRREDPVTPILHPWTYQAMIHELLTIKDHMVDLKGRKGAKEEQETFVLNPGFMTPSTSKGLTLTLTPTLGL